MTYRAVWDDDLDRWTVIDRGGVIVARGMPDRQTAEDVADVMTLADAAVPLDPTLAAYA